MTELPDMKLELIPIPVTDIDRALAFYVDKIGFHLDHDTRPSNDMRIVQLTPPGSGCSILLSKGLGEVSDMKPGSVKGLHLVVATDAEECFANYHEAPAVANDL